MGIHHGKNVKRMRELMGVKQESLAADLGMSQQSVSLLEQKETIDAALVEKICVILGVPEETITQMTEDRVMNFFSGTFTGNTIGTSHNSTYHYNPVEKWMEAIKKNEELYERLVASEREKVEMLMKLVEGKK